MSSTRRRIIRRQRQSQANAGSGQRSKTGPRRGGGTANMQDSTRSKTASDIISRRLGSRLGLTNRLKKPFGSFSTLIDASPMQGLRSILKSRLTPSRLIGSRREITRDARSLAPVFRQSRQSTPKPAKSRSRQRERDAVVEPSEKERRSTPRERTDSRSERTRKTQSPNERRKDDGPTCKPRPTDNRGSGGSRAFVPWCDRRR